MAAKQEGGQGARTPPRRAGRTRTCSASSRTRSCATTSARPTTPRSAYGRASNGKAPAKALLDDKKLQKELKTPATRCATPATRCAKGQQKRKKRRLGRLLLLGIVGAGLAIAVSEDLRNKVLDALFGAEEEFDYTSTTSPPAPAPAPDPAGTASNN